MYISIQGASITLSGNCYMKPLSKKNKRASSKTSGPRVLWAKVYFQHVWWRRSVTPEPWPEGRAGAGRLTGRCRRRTPRGGWDTHYSHCCTEPIRMSHCEPDMAGWRRPGTGHSSDTMTRALPSPVWTHRTFFSMFNTQLSSRAAYTDDIFTYDPLMQLDVLLEIFMFTALLMAG